MPKIIAFAFMRQAFLISCSLACTETKQDWLLIFSTPWQLYFIKNEILLYKQQKTKAGDKFTLSLPSMKVFRISGRDARLSTPTIAPLTRLNESLPHKRKRRLYSLRPATAVSKRLNESLPYKRKRLHIHCPNERRRYASMKVFRISGRDWSYDSCRITWIHSASMKVFRISGRDPRRIWSPMNPCVASMKVFRISGRDLGFRGTANIVLGLNESLPHKRKRPYASEQMPKEYRSLNESLPHKRKRPPPTRHMSRSGL